MARSRLLALSLLGLMACDSAPVAVPKPPPPPPLPALTASKPSEASPHERAGEPSELPTREPSPARAQKHATSAEKASVKAAKSSGPRRDPLPTASAETRPPPSSAPPPPPASQAPQIIATTPKPATASKVSVPKTVHVAIDVPPGLQADLDRDPRMQPWVNQVVATIDRCYGSESKSHGKLSGTIEVLVTMHENERPDADIKQLPPALSPLVACATGGLMRTKMPLFTGKEGSRYTVRLRFSP